MTSEREALRAKNSEPSALEREALGSGDASLKKNTSYLKRIRTALAQSDQTEGLVKDISHLRLDKYLEELVQAVSEASLRVKVGTEVQAAAKVISALHQHFGHDAFTAPLVAALTAQCKLPVVTSKNVPQDQRDKEESARVSRQRALLRLLAELDVVGLIKTDKIQPGQVTWQLLQDLLLATDKDLLLAHASIALAITKHCAFLLPPLDQSASVQASTALVHPDIQAKFLALLQTFYNHLSNRAVKDRLLLLTQEKSNNEAYIRSGELFEDRKANFDRLVARWDKMWASVQSLAEVLHLQMPELPQAQSVPTSSSLVVSAAAHVTGPQPDGSVWDPRFVDEEEMRFYKDLKDLHVGDNHVQVVSTIPQEEAPSSAHEDQLESVLHLIYCAWCLCLPASL